MTKLSNLCAVIAAAACAVGCASSTATGPGPLRFHNRAPVTLVNDRVPIALPATYKPGLREYHLRENWIEPTRRAFTVSDHRRAENPNSLGEVPDSAWFTNRAPLTPAQIRRGPGGGGPDRSEPWRVVGVKVGGMAIGITIKDARGDRYVLKFDERGHAETESAADVIVQRLAWAFGYNVPDNEVVNFQREQLQLDPEALVRDIAGNERPMTAADLEQYLAMAESDHGTFRGLASKFIDGKILGGVEPEGVRKDDPNDRVPHELRRDLRGQRMLWAWVNHPDIKALNALSAFTDDGYVKWYTLDYGESLGVGARTTGMPRLGFRNTYSLRDSMLALVTLGLYVRPWEKRDHYPDYRGLGHFDSESFDPGGWQPNHNWRPTDIADRFDELWAAEILLRFTRAHIQAAVEAGKYTDPRTTEYVVRTLLGRQRKIGRHAFARVAPLTRFEVRGGKAGALEVCFDDLWLRHAYGLPAATRYHVSSFDHAGTSLGRAERVAADADARTCVGGLRAGASHAGYTVAKIEIWRSHGNVPPVFVHVARGPRGFRVIGLDRR